MQRRLRERVIGALDAYDDEDVIEYEVDLLGWTVARLLLGRDISKARDRLRKQTRSKRFLREPFASCTLASTALLLQQPARALTKRARKHLDEALTDDSRSQDEGLFEFGVALCHFMGDASMAERLRQTRMQRLTQTGAELAIETLFQSGRQACNEPLDRTADVFARLAVDVVGGPPFHYLAPQVLLLASRAARSCQHRSLAELLQLRLDALDSAVFGQGDRPALEFKKPVLNMVEDTDGRPVLEMLVRIRGRGELSVAGYGLEPFGVEVFEIIERAENRLSRLRGAKRPQQTELLARTLHGDGLVRLVLAPSAEVHVCETERAALEERLKVAWLHGQRRTESIGIDPLRIEMEIVVRGPGKAKRSCRA